ncbi:siderophore iron transporter [Cordyceps javanica]|uniref:Siderophore iron transporter n=1 Tax=Cordyceps javanica TaxID=43265 RepID=A0A545US03_9HYPO|nr:siderophore iron transporter [Cordyceps javanica]TQW03965.1 siderophore iron transporter [Cordyceps javanica]
MDKPQVDSRGGGALGIDDRRRASHDRELGTKTPPDAEAVACYDSDKPIDPNAQGGVQKVEAMANVWTTSAMVLAYLLIWLIYFVDSMQQGITGALTPFVVSQWRQYSLTPTVNIVSSIVGGVFKLTIAKILDIFGRPQGYLLSVACATLGLLMMATCQNVPAYAAAQVFYWVGMNGIQYSLTVTLADMSSLRNRGLVIAYANTPYIITAWITGPISDHFLPVTGTLNLRWAFGIFTIITPAVTLPLFFLMVYNYRKAKRLGVIAPRQSNRGPLQSFLYYCREFDIVGLLLLSVGLVLFLLPFNIYSHQKEGWRSPIVIAFLIVGFFLIVAFFVWERNFAPVTFIPYALLLDRTVATSCVFAAVGFISYYIWDAFFYGFLRVVVDLSNTHALYVTQTYNVGSCLWGLVAGWFLRATGRYKPAVLFFGLPLLTLGVGLMIKFRHPGVSVGYIIMCQIFVAFGGGTNVIGQEVAIMSRVTHQHIAVVLAIQNMAASVGGAIGLSVSAAVWQAVFPKKLRAYLPESALANFTTIAGDVNTQVTYPVGSPIRAALQRAYGDAQQNMLIAATAILAISFVCVALWHDTNVKHIKQTKGRVF